MVQADGASGLMRYRVVGGLALDDDARAPRGAVADDGAREVRRVDGRIEMVGERLAAQGGRGRQGAPQWNGNGPANSPMLSVCVNNVPPAQR